MQYNFDASTVAPNLGLSPIPAGIYTCSIAAQEVKPTRQNDGSYLEIIWQVTEGEFTGRKLFERLNLWNNSPQAVEIAHGTMSSILRATGKIRIQQDTSELVGQTAKVEVGIQPGRVDKNTGEQYDAQNRIKGYHSMTGQPLNQIGGMPGGAGAMPWQAPGQGPAQPQPAFASPQHQAAHGMAGGAQSAPGVANPAGPMGGGQPSWAQGQPTQPQPPAPPQNQPVVPPPMQQPQVMKRLTAKAGQTPMEWFQQNGWSEQQMIEQGYLEVSYPQPVQPTTPPLPQGPVAPQAPAAPQGFPGASVPNAGPQQPPAPQAGFAQQPSAPSQPWQPPQGATPTAPGGPVQTAPWAR